MGESGRCGSGSEGKEDIWIGEWMWTEVGQRAGLSLGTPGAVCARN